LAVWNHSLAGVLNSKRSSQFVITSEY